jgi:aryl-alcohol dehydrogenase-like predicted oxidoreductase
MDGPISHASDKVYIALELTQIPKTNIQTSRLGFGTASLHHLHSEAARKNLLAAALDTGFTYFDTARIYGEGQAERTLGDFFAGDLRKNVTIATKIGLPAVPLLETFPKLMYGQKAVKSLVRNCGISLDNHRKRDLSVVAAEKSLTMSMKALKTDWIDILFVHEPQLSDLIDLYALGNWFGQIRSGGRVRYLGLAGNAENCLNVTRYFPDMFDVMQVEDSLENKEADLVVQAGWPIQITYGYLRLANKHAEKSSESPGNILNTINGALTRNPEGLVLISSRKSSHLKELSLLADEKVLF